MNPNSPFIPKVSPQQKALNNKTKGNINLTPKPKGTITFTKKPDPVPLPARRGVLV